MFDIGNYNELIADEFTEHGLFLINESEPDKRILLPGVELKNREVKIGEKLNLFVYLDAEARPTVTFKKSLIEIFTFSYLQIKDISKHGAFAYCGLPKDLFIPYRELSPSIDKGDYAIVFMYFDNESKRLVGTTKVSAVLSNENVDLKVGDEVNILVWKRTDLGYKLIINDQYEGLVFHSDVFKDIRVGEKHTAYVKQIREDKKIDISFQKVGVAQIDDDAYYIYGQLLENDGALPFSDKSSPESIKDRFGMSKKAFKRAIGKLYSEKKITIEDGRIIKSRGK